MPHTPQKRSLDLCDIMAEVFPDKIPSPDEEPNTVLELLHSLYESAKKAEVRDMEIIRKMDRIEDRLSRLEEIAQSHLSSILSSLKHLALTASKAPDEETAKMAITGIQEALNEIPKEDLEAMIEDALGRQEESIKEFVRKGVDHLMNGLNISDDNTERGFRNYGDAILGRLTDIQSRLSSLDSDLSKVSNQVDALRSGGGLY